MTEVLLTRKTKVKVTLTNASLVEAAVKAEIDRKVRSGQPLTKEVLTHCTKLGTLHCPADFSVEFVND